jgi:hypothetical protein
MFQHIVFYVTLGVAMMSCVLAIINFKLLDVGLKIIFAFLLISISADTVSAVMVHLKLNTSWWFNLYTFFEFALIGIFYVWLFKNSNSIQFIVVTTAILLGFIGIFLFTLIEYVPDELNTKSLGLEATIFIFISVGYFYVLLNKMEFENPYYNPIFWINSGVLIYFSGAFFSFMFSAPKFQELGIWSIHSVIHLIFMILILVGFWKVRKT